MKHALLLPWVLAALGAQAPEFADGRLEDLRCRVVSAKRAVGDSVLCEVEVRNGGALACEPMLFRILAGKDAKPQLVARAPMPHAARWGNGVAARGSRKFLLQFRGAADAKNLRVDVARAVFHRGAPQPESPVTVGRLSETHATVDGERMRATAIALRNDAAVPVDLVLRVSYDDAGGEQGLVTVRLQAREQREALVAQRPLELGWSEPASMANAKIVRAEVVDWTTLQPDEAGCAEAMQALRAAYERWARWPEPRPSCTGTFVAVTQRQGEAGDALQRHEGSFRLAADGAPVLELRGAPPAALRARIERAVVQAFADLRRPSFDALAAAHRLVQMQRGVIGVDGPPPDWMLGDLFALDGGRITGLRLAEAEHAITQNWLLQSEADGYLVIGRDTMQAALGDEPAEVERRAYARLGTWLVPVSLRVETRYPATGFFDVMQLTLSCDEPQPAGAAAPGEPTGDGVAALHEAWDAAYAYPDRPHELRAKFEAKTPGTDQVWLGQRSVAGTVALGGFRGFRVHPAAWSAPVTAISGKKYGDQDAARLGAALVDRLWLWAGRDFCGRLPFAQAFRGARIAAAAEGVFRIENCLYDEVEVRDRLVVRLREAGGRERHYEWNRVGGRDVPVRITTGREVLSATWQVIDADWVLPVELRFERVFGDDWGPETVRLRDVALRE